MTASTVPRRARHGRKNQRRLVQAIVAALCVPAGAAAAQDDAPKPSAIEHALVEYLCRSIQGPTMLGTEQYQSCYTAQLDALREPFGANLSKLTGAERKSLDAAQQSPSQNVINLQRRVAGVLPVRIDVPRTGTLHRFVRPLVIDEETTVTFRYKALN